MDTRILIIDDEAMFREDLATLLTEEGYTCQTASDAEMGLEAARTYQPDVVLCDIVMPGLTGVEALASLVEICPSACIMMITAHGTLDTAVEAFRKGAYDYVLKPLVLEDVFRKIERFVEHRRLVDELRVLRRSIQPTGPEESGMVGDSPAFRRMIELVDRAADTDATVLIRGESGTGKELVARALHERSSRSNHTFVALNCAALPEHLMESELFGHKKGAFTGADSDREGLLEVANKGTLLLDEVTEMPLVLQAKLLRVVEQKEIRRLGDNRVTKVDTRFVASTNRDLKRAVEDGVFREDLLYRLRVMEIELPPLRERREDIPGLVTHFVKRLNREMKKQVLGGDAEVMRILMAYGWPGNIRELENAVERAMILTQDEYIGVRDLPPDLAGDVTAPEMSDNLRDAVRAYERAHIVQILAGCDGNREAAARKLGINPSTLYRKMADLQIE